MYTKRVQYLVGLDFSAIFCVDKIRLSFQPIIHTFVNSHLIILKKNNNCTPYIGCHATVCSIQYTVPYFIKMPRRLRHLPFMRIVRF